MVLYGNFDNEDKKVWGWYLRSWKKPDNCADDDDEQGNLDREQRVYNYLTINPPRIVVTPVMTSPTPILQASPLWEVGGGFNQDRSSSRIPRMTRAVEMKDPSQ